MDAPVPLIFAALFAAGAILAPSPRSRAGSMLAALLLTPVILVAHVHDNTAFATLRHHPAAAVAAAVAALVAVGALAVVFDRRPALFPLAAVAMVPFRVPIAGGGSTSNLLVPLYAVIAAAALAYAVPRLRGGQTPEEHPIGWLERLLGISVLLYAVQATYSSDFAHALENGVFFYIPFTLLFVLLGRVEWTAALARRCLIVVAVLALALAGVGFAEYATKHLLLNPKVIASNQFASYFRVNSLFFDPNIYGRFLAIVMIGLAAVVVWGRDRRDVLLGAGVLAILWAGLVLTFSQSSFVALLVGLAMLGGMRWSRRGAAAIGMGLLVVGVLFVAIAPGAIRLDVGDSKSADSATSGRYDLIKGGTRLFDSALVVGHGSGSFGREYRHHEKASSQRATSASHTIPVTIAAEQGLLGLAVYLALLLAALTRLLRGARASVPRAAVAAAFVALVVHTFMYAAFLEDPMTWALLGIGAALARGARAPVAPTEPA